MRLTTGRSVGRFRSGLNHLGKDSGFLLVSLHQVDPKLWEEKGGKEIQMLMEIVLHRELKPYQKSVL